MTKELFEELLIAQAKEKQDSELFNYIYDRLVNLNTLISVEECDNSIKSLNAMKEAVDNVEAPEERKARWYRLVDDGIYVCNREKSLIKEKI